MNVTDPVTPSWVWKPGPAAAPRQCDRLEAGAARAGERAAGPRRLSRCRSAAGQNQALWIEIYTGRDRPAGMYAGPSGRDRGRPRKSCPLVELERLRLRAAGREQPARDGLLRERSAGAVPGPQPRRGLPPLRPPPARRAGARLRRSPTARAAPGRFDGTRFTRASAATRARARASGNVIVPASFYGPGRAFDDRRAPGRCGRLDDVSAAVAAAAH